jgi:hypothetical protein
MKNTAFTPEDDAAMLAASFGKQVRMCDRPQEEEQRPPDNEADRTPLPAGWVEEMDARSKVSFYMNVEKGETTWIRPVPDGTTNVVDTAAEGATTADDATILTTNAGESLPEGWIEMKDAFSGVAYYVNSDGDTTWKRPDAKSP